MKASFKPREIPRCLIKTADYNPRTIGAAERKRLWSVLDKHGLVEGLVWNKRTGNLVGGHQRLEWWDSKFPAPADPKALRKHLVPVAQVDISLEQEKALNIALNNRSAQGEFDDAKLTALLREIGDLAQSGAAGFDSDEIDALLEEAASVLRPLDEAPPPKMAWALVGIPLGRFGEISGHMEAMAAIPGILLESTVSDHGAPPDGLEGPDGTIGADRETTAEA